MADGRCEKKEGRRQKEACCVVLRGDLEASLARLPIGGLRLADLNVAMLHELGVKTIGELLALPRKGLSSRFGPGLLLRLDQALGQANELIHPHRPPPEFQAEWLLEQPTQRREEVELILQQLVQRVAAQLAQRQVGATRLACRLDAAGRKPLCFTVGLYRATASAMHLWELVQMQLERLRSLSAIGRIGLSAVLTAPLETHQSQFFDDVSLRTARAQALLLDRLSSRLGAEAVLRPLLIPDALPERGVKMVGTGMGTGDRGPGKRRQKKVSTRAQRSMADSRCQRSDGKASQVTGGIKPSAICHLTSDIRSPVPSPQSPPTLSSHRPLLLLSPPQEIETNAVAPDGPPVRLFCEKQLHDIVRHWGPERIETAWWRGRSVRRDYYRVETVTGQRFWLFRELRYGRWYLHGLFE